MSSVAEAVSRLVTIPFRWGSAARHARVFHPRGIICTATLSVSTEHPSALPIGSGVAVVRLSKGIGTPGGSPDIAGMALRVLVTGEVGTHWDILLASSIGPAQRIGVPLPVTTWAGTSLSSLVPFRIANRLVYLRAVMLDDEGAATGLSLDVTDAAPDVFATLRFALEEAEGVGPFRRIGVVALTGVDVMSEVDFDPTGTLPQGITLFPDWLAALRTGAYSNSRRGRRLGVGG